MYTNLKVNSFKVALAVLYGVTEFQRRQDIVRSLLVHVLHILCVVSACLKAMYSLILVHPVKQPRSQISYSCHVT